jgi:pimeloyl-ACP methyl ester carboxylesterase
VLLHGAMADNRDWRLQIDDLAGDFTVVAWDAPGCGGSFDPPDDFGLEGYADSLATFIGRLGLDTPHVMGLSFGSVLALELFRRHPECVRSLVLLSGYAGWAGSLGHDEAEQRRRWVNRWRTCRRAGSRPTSRPRCSPRRSRRRSFSPTSS